MCLIALWKKSYLNLETNKNSEFIMHFPIPIPDKEALTWK